MSALNRLLSLIGIENALVMFLGHKLPFCFATRNLFSRLPFLSMCLEAAIYTNVLGKDR